MDRAGRDPMHFNDIGNQAVIDDGPDFRFRLNALFILLAAVSADMEDYLSNSPSVPESCYGTVQ